MSSSVRTIDRLPAILAVSFLLVGIAHFACRYDFERALEKPFPKAFASQSSTEPTTSVTTASQTITTAPSSEVALSIARNPFLMPVAALPASVTTPVAPVTPVATAGTTSASNVYVAETPRLTGVLMRGTEKVAIIALRGQSDFYSIGQSIGSYVVNNISDNSISLDQDGRNIELYLGGNN
ncbi:MAG TPA: hypothetical protein IAB06_02625 [Candidatus Avacidaminococcus intestinavium]|uniref:Uncharacterized protein n=1 Tax=Candidatus Avacidaminococcus intestinavium TaxID=2840684 RepID=A0A9D1MP64_9FIRM|nr:hypothetical protein [Candidatus Avacidaminococcus intestinavium]